MPLTDAEIVEWLDSHEPQIEEVPCILCDVAVTRQTVVGHLVNDHKPASVAILVALWWFLREDDEDAAP